MTINKKTKTKQAETAYCHTAETAAWRMNCHTAETAVWLESYESASNHVFWVLLCRPVVSHVGWWRHDGLLSLVVDDCFQSVSRLLNSLWVLSQGFWTIWFSYCGGHKLKLSLVLLKCFQFVARFSLQARTEVRSQSLFNFAMSLKTSTPVTACSLSQKQ